MFRKAVRGLAILALAIVLALALAGPAMAMGLGQVEEGSYITDLIRTAEANSASLVGLVMALTTIAGMFGLAGKTQLGFALTLGILLGGGAQIAEIGVPIDFAGWFALLIYGLVVGASAVGVYETGKKLLKKPDLPQVVIK